SEAVNNAVLYGYSLATVRIWAGPDRIVVHVHDHGSGAANPLAGLIPPAGSLADAELGLWLTHQLGIDVALIFSDDGFAVRLRAGRISAWEGPAGQAAVRCRNSQEAAAMDTARIPAHQASAMTASCEAAAPVAVCPIHRPRMVSTIGVNGWLSAKACSAPGMV